MIPAYGHKFDAVTQMVGCKRLRWVVGLDSNTTDGWLRWHLFVLMSPRGGPAEFEVCVIGEKTESRPDVGTEKIEAVRSGEMVGSITSMPRPSAKRQIYGGLSMLVWAFPLASQDQTRHENAKSMNCAMLGIRLLMKLFEYNSNIDIGYETNLKATNLCKNGLARPKILWSLSTIMTRQYR